jgi:hypothetical protein
VRAPGPAGRGRDDIVLQFDSTPAGAVVYDGTNQLFVTPFKLTLARDGSSRRYVARMAGQPDQVRVVFLNQSQSVRFRFAKREPHVRRPKAAPGSKPAPRLVPSERKPRFGDHPVTFGD